MVRGTAARRRWVGLVASVVLLAPIPAAAGDADETQESVEVARSLSREMGRLLDSRLALHVSELESSQPARRSGFRERNVALFRYDTPLRILESDVLFKLRAPGAKRSIVTLELLF